MSGRQGLSGAAISAGRGEETHIALSLLPGLAAIAYGDAAEVQSWLLYIKSSVTGDETADVINDRATHPDFAHDSTADQFFSPSGNVKATGDSVSTSAAICWFRAQREPYG